MKQAINFVGVSIGVRLIPGLADCIHEIGIPVYGAKGDGMPLEASKFFS